MKSDKPQKSVIFNYDGQICKKALDIDNQSRVYLTQSQSEIRSGFLFQKLLFFIARDDRGVK